ncbi:MAG: hypothetical protein M5U01_18710 [Ardenticatenaceae bacterium]|nr:hypothetical protein [Ardenticatenaceae bacterium]
MSATLTTLIAAEALWPIAASDTRREVAYPTGAWDLAPDLAGEVGAPGERVTGVQGKVRDSPAAVTRLVWVVSARSRTMIPPTLAGLVHTCSAATLVPREPLPGVACHMAEVFA